MNVEQFALVRKSDNTELMAWGGAMPAVFSVQGMDVHGAGPDWKNDNFQIVSRSIDAPDPVETTPQQAAAKLFGISDDQFAKLLKFIGTL